MLLTDREFLKRAQEDKMLLQFSDILRKPDVKSLMLKLITSNISNVIDINRSLLHQSKFYTIPESKFKLFEWRLTEYMERLLKDEHYINVHKYDKPHSLSIYKCLVDLSSLKNILCEIVSSSNRALDILRDCLQNFTILDDLKKELKNNTKIFANEIKEFDTLASYTENEQKINQNIQNDLLDGCSDEVLIIDPLVLRLTKHTLQAYNEDCESHLQKEKNELESAIYDYKERLTLGQSSHEQYMAHSYQEIAALKYKFQYWLKKYDEDYDKYESTNSNLELSVKAMKAHMKGLHGRLINFFPIELAKAEHRVLLSRIRPEPKKFTKSKKKHTKLQKSDGKKK